MRWIREREIRDRISFSPIQKSVADIFQHYAKMERVSQRDCYSDAGH